jgi:hypothetical protein
MNQPNLHFIAGMAEVSDSVIPATFVSFDNGYLKPSGGSVEDDDTRQAEPESDH